MRPILYRCEQDLNAGIRCAVRRHRTGDRPHARADAGASARDSVVVDAIAHQGYLPALALKSPALPFLRTGVRVVEINRNVNADGMAHVDKCINGELPDLPVYKLAYPGLSYIKPSSSLLLC